jgi:hypothetical protein
LAICRTGTAENTAEVASIVGARDREAHGDTLRAVRRARRGTAVAAVAPGLSPATAAASCSDDLGAEADAGHGRRPVPLVACSRTARLHGDACSARPPLVMATVCAGLTARARGKDTVDDAKYAGGFASTPTVLDVV